MTTKFESGKTYAVGNRCDRVYFKVVARTAKTATFELVGIQKDASRFDSVRVDVAGNGETQKIHLYVEDDTEFGYIKVTAENAWGNVYTDRVYIEPKKAVTIPKVDTTTEADTEAGSNNTAQIEETEQKFFYTTNRGNTREVKVGETGSTVRSRWYYYHEIGGISEQDVIKLAQSEGSEFVNALCKFIANDTDGSEEDDAESFTANVMPAEDDDTDDELIDEPDRRTIERNSGNYSDLINGEYVKFENHSIVYIDAERKIGFSYDKRNGRKNFYRYGRKIAAAKIAEAYMNGERAAEQSKAHHEFFYAHKLEVGNPFKVSFDITTADGQEHFFSRTFETFAEAKALVDEFTATFSEPTQIVIKQNKQNGDWFYSRDTDGTEKFFDAYFGNDGFDPEVFSLLPALDDLNDMEDEPTTEDFTATEAEENTAQVEDEPALVDCAYEFDAENGVREFKIGDAETGDVISFQGSRLFKITSTEHDARLYRDEDGTLHFDIKCCDGSPQLTMHDVTPDEFFAYVEVHDTTREEIARLPLVELKRKHARAVDESLRLGEYLFCSEERTTYDKAHARLMQLICNGCADTAERWRLEEENAPRRKRIVDAEIKYSCLQYKIGKYAEEIDAREKDAVRAHEPHEDVPNVEGDNLHDSAKIVSATPEASTKIKKLFSRRKNYERKKTARHTQHRPRRMVHAARRH